MPLRELILRAQRDVLDRHARTVLWSLVGLLVVGGVVSQFELFNKSLSDDSPGRKCDNGSMPNHSSKPKRPRDINQLAKFVVDLATGEIPAESTPVVEPIQANPPQDPPKPEKLAAAVELGRRGGLKGGKARAASMTPDQRSGIARKAASARWNKAKK